MDAYDRYPYESLTFPETHPETLALLGRLFGLDPADPDRCRVLELGCASGGNLIPMAFQARTSRFVGIDLSRQQIAQGQRLLDRLSLDNVELRAADIQDLAADFGPFDFIIAHGVFSWVPAPVRRHLLEIAPALLGRDGLLYVSFNTLPGWRMRGMLRDILLYSCRGIDDPDEKLAMAFSALDRLERSLQGLEALSARYLLQEIDYLRKKTHPSYLLYDYLAEHNEALLFSDFLEQARGHELRYLCDTELSTLFPSTFGERVEKALADINDDFELEQWLDFVINRNFRRAVLCRDDATPEDELDLDVFAATAFAADLSPAKRPDLRRPRAASYRLADGTAIEVSHPLTKAMLGLLQAQFPDSSTLGHLLPRAQQLVAEAGGPAGDTEASLAELFSLYAHGAMRPGSRARRYPRGGDRPRINALVRAQVEMGQMHVAAAHHASLDLDELSLFLLCLLDGTRTVEQLVDELVRAQREKRLTPPKGIRIDQRKIEAQTRQGVMRLLRDFDRHALFEPAA